MIIKNILLFVLIIFIKLLNPVAKIQLAFSPQRAAEKVVKYLLLTTEGQDLDISFSNSDLPFCSWKAFLHLNHAHGTLTVSQDMYYYPV